MWCLDLPILSARILSTWSSSIIVEGLSLESFAFYKTFMPVVKVLTLCLAK